MAWAEWVHHGFDEALFWRSTADEVGTVLKRAQARYDRLDMLAGLIASTVHNMAGKVAKRPMKPGDFFRRAAAGAPRMTPEQQERFERRPLMRAILPDRQIHA